MNHIVYLSYEEGKNGRSYIGKHSTLDLHDGYLGSYKDAEFSPVGKIVLGYYKSAESAIAAEIQWQRVFDVVQDSSFANRAFQTSTGWDTTGRKRPLHETQPGGLAMRGKLVWNNGAEVTRSKDCPGEGWKRGFLETQQINLPNHTDVPWWTNEKTGERRRTLKRPGEEWVEGRGEMATNTQLWRCTETGKITTSGPLTRYQNSRGIDKSCRERIS
jgi:hypothetical protein